MLSVTKNGLFQNMKGDSVNGDSHHVLRWEVSLL